MFYMYGSGADVHGKAIRVLVTATELAVYLSHYSGKELVDV